MRAAPLVILGIAAYGAFLAATMPASFVAAQVERRVPDRLHVRDAHGTLWHGAAQAEVAIPGGWLVVDNLAWRIEPSQLLRGRVAFAVDAQAAGLAAQGTVARSVSSWHASGEATGAAAFAGAVSPLLSTWRPDGRVTLRTNGLEWDEREARGDVQAEWRDAAVALSRVRPLGSYRATLHAEGPRGRIDLATLAGPLRLAGQGEIVFPSRFTLNGEARADATAGAALDPLLDLLGPRRPDGARTLSWRAS